MCPGAAGPWPLCFPPACLERPDPAPDLLSPLVAHSKFSLADMVYGAVEDLPKAAELPGPGTLCRLTVEQVPAETKWADVATALAAPLPTGRAARRPRKRPRAAEKKQD